MLVGLVDRRWGNGEIVWGRERGRGGGLVLDKMGQRRA